ncbi:chain length determinant protein, partial [Streptomyces sp. NPDC059956]
PFMWLSVTGTDPAAVLKSDQLFTAYAEKRLLEFQAQQSVTPEAMIRMATIVPPQKPEAQTKTRLQYLVMAAALGFVLSLVATFFVEARRRKADKPGRRGPVAGGGEPPENPGPEPGPSDRQGSAVDPTATMALKVLPPSAFRSKASP